MAAPKRLARPSATETLTQLGFIGQSPIDLEDKIRAVVELRPQRPEEHFPYSIHRWQQKRTIAAAGAGRFNGVWIGSGGVGQDQKGALHVVERLINNSANFMSIRSGALPAFAIDAIGGALPRDVRINQVSQELFPGFIHGGDTAAISGVEIGNLNAAAAGGEYSALQIDHVLLAFSPIAGGGDGLLVWNGAANTQLQLTMIGYTVLPR